MTEIIIAAGIPAGVFGLAIWLMKRWISKRDAEKAKEDEARHKAAEEREKNYETMMLMIMQNSRATYILSQATAKAVQRIPDAHCNGDMTHALEEAERIQQEEQKFLIDQGVKHIFGD